MKTVLLLAVLSLFAVQGVRTVRDFPTLNHIKSKTPLSQQADAVKDLIGRVLGNRTNLFKVLVNDSIGPPFRDTFNLVSDGSVVTIAGTSGVAAAMGFYYYLKVYCGCQYTWAGAQLDLPQPLPIIPSPGETITSNDRFRYYQNVCTVSYSFVWWNWTRWEREIDWMAMNGINLPLAFTGQEAIFQRVYMAMGITMEELQEHFAGPAFLAWGRMGNIRGWGGPMTQTWIDKQLVLQHKILERMRSLGIIPVLPGFAGHVPKAITRIYPNASVSRLGDWGHFNQEYCCTYLLDFNDPLFKKIGSDFIKLMNYEFGVDHIYNADTFNEMVPKSNSTTYLAAAGRLLYESMVAGDPDAIWLMQGWLFLDKNFWKQEQIKALLTSVPHGKMIILDLFSEVHPIFTETESYYGQPFIWCMLHNFGGTMELYGDVTSVNEGPFMGRTFPNSTMIGTGLTPEGINQNEVMYELMNENAYAKKARNLTLWFSNFARGRYGSTDSDIDAAWQLLRTSVYNCPGGSDHSNNVVPTSRPRLTPALHQSIWYNTSDLYTAWGHLVTASRMPQFYTKDLFRYDLVDVTRNSLQILSIKYYDELAEAYKAKNSSALHESGMKLIDLLYDMDLILKTVPQFLLGNWIEAARYWGMNNNEKFWLAFNARNQITLWGPTGEIRDYACKQWAGLVGSVYTARWQLFINMLTDSITTGQPFSQDEYDQQVYEKVEWPFSIQNLSYPTFPQNDPAAVARFLYEKYKGDTTAPIFDQLYRKYQNSIKEEDQLNPIERKYFPNLVVPHQFDKYNAKVLRKGNKPRPFQGKYSPSIVVQ